ncbi:MAG TPA: alpha/beta hydrolase [Solirubrobacteraceae bacterium]|nr:alpha/beta hydrolase [Solirubrobacteraceae bacterium]
MSRELLFKREGVRLACLDFGGSGIPVVLLHGLAGHGGEWAESASWLTEHHRVIAIDARGHGNSEHVPEDVSRAAHVADTAFVIEELGLGPVILVGQSLGGHTAFLTAAANPDLIRALVVIEATPESATSGEVEQRVLALGDSLAAWPVPFESMSAAVSFWGGPSVKAHAWASGLEDRAGMLWPRFDLTIMMRTLREGICRPCWQEWEALRMPTLIVRGAQGPIPLTIFTSMGERQSRAQLVEIPDAGHDLHIEAPSRWKDAFTAFLAGV